MENVEKPDGEEPTFDENISEEEREHIKRVDKAQTIAIAEQVARDLDDLVTNEEKYRSKGLVNFTEHIVSVAPDFWHEGTELSGEDIAAINAIFAGVIAGSRLLAEEIYKEKPTDPKQLIDEINRVTCAPVLSELKKGNLPLASALHRKFAYLGPKIPDSAWYLPKGFWSGLNRGK